MTAPANEPRAAAPRTRIVVLGGGVGGLAATRHLERRFARRADGAVHELPYDHVVVALGAMTNVDLIPGSEHARTFKTVADALLLRNHVIERLERADQLHDGTGRRDRYDRSSAARSQPPRFAAAA